jgi:cardiolipin synthase
MLLSVALLSVVLLILAQPSPIFASLPSQNRSTMLLPPVPDNNQLQFSSVTTAASSINFSSHHEDNNLSHEIDERNLIAFPNSLEHSTKPHTRDQQHQKQTTAGTDFRALTHLIGSHAAIITRPVTAAIRLFFMVYDTGKDAVRWTWLSGFEGKPIPSITRLPGMDLGEWESRLDKITRKPTSHGKVQFYLGGGEFFPELAKEIKIAQKSIRLRTYIFDNDDFALEIADTLKQRSKQVDVRVLLDGLGSIVANKTSSDTAPKGHSPPGSVRNYLTSNSAIRVRQQFNTWFAGDHAKTIIIDGKRAFLGGMNIGHEYRYDWHDVMVKVEGPVVKELTRDFGRAWAGAGVLGDIEKLIHGLKPHKRGKNNDRPPLRLLFTRPGDSQIRNAQLEAIRRSQRSIYIESPYITDDGIVYELIKARRRGVDVKVIIPSVNNWQVMDSSNSLTANALIENGVRVFLYPGMTHVKAAIFDGWACFGSANMDKLSLRVNYEIDLATSHPETVTELRNNLFHKDIAVSTELIEPIPVRNYDYLMEVLADQL